MGFQILSATSGVVEVTYDVEFSANGSATDTGSSVNTAAPEESKGSPDAGAEGVGAVAALAVVAGGALALTGKRRK